jgi:hypothetical protein
MSEYYLHDAENGKPQLAAQIWRDAHTVDQLASKIRAHLLATRTQLTKVTGPVELATEEYKP